MQNPGLFTRKYVSSAFKLFETHKHLPFDRLGDREGAPNFPGKRVLDGFCWDLEDVGATEGVLWLAANPGHSLFAHLCCDLDVENLRILVHRYNRKHRKVRITFYLHFSLLFDTSKVAFQTLFALLDVAPLNHLTSPDPEHYIKRLNETLLYFLKSRDAFNRFVYFSGGQL